MEFYSFLYEIKMGSSKEIFISYRRDTGSELAEIIKKDLDARGYSVFKDTHDLKAGHWQEALTKQINACKDFILLVTPGSLDRCKTDPNDIVLFEIRLALATRKNFILVVKRAKDQSPNDYFKDLPLAIADLPKHNWVEYTNDDSDAKLQKIRSFLNSSPSVWEIVNNRYGKQILASVICVGLLVCGLLGWGIFGRTGKIESKIEEITSDTKATLDITGNVREQNQEIVKDTGVLRKDSADLMKKTQEIAKSSSAAQNASEKSLSTVQNIEGKLDDVKKTIRQSIGTKNLGFEYENTQFHRQYQTEVLAKDDVGKMGLKSLLVEYQNLVSSNPKNAMYRYLLARLYDQAEKSDLALVEIKAGYAVDASYMWNRRYLLYFDTTQPIDLEKRLAMEVEHYKITPDEVSMFSSPDPSKFMKAFEMIKERFQADPTISVDLKNLNFCWHLFKCVSGMTYANGKAFKSLVGMEAVSERNLVQLKILDVKTGVEALTLIGKTPVNMVSYVDNKERIGVTNLVRNVKSRKVEPLNTISQLQKSLIFPPIALRLSISAQNPMLNLNSIRKREFSLGGHLRSQPPIETKELFEQFLTKGIKKIDLKKMLGLPITEIEISDATNFSDFWIYFFSHPSPWDPDSNSLFDLKFTAPVGENSIRLVDIVKVTNDYKNNLKKPIVDAVEILALYQKLRAMKNIDLKGQKIQIPMEAKVFVNFGGVLSCKLFNLNEFEINILYGPKASSTYRDAIKIATDLDLKWPSANIQEEFSKLANNDWFKFTGTVINNEAGRLTIISDKLFK